MTKVIQILWKIFLFSFPFSLHVVLYEQYSYRFGNFNPWVTGFLFLPEILLLLIFLLKFRELKFRIKSWGMTTLLLSFFLNAAVVTFWKGDPVLWGFFLFHGLMGIIFYRLLQEDILTVQKTASWLLYGALFQIFLAFMQVKLNHSIGLSWLGEPHLGATVANVAKTNLETGEKIIRGYGTFLHPNILGVYLILIALVALPHFKKYSRFFVGLLLLLGIYLTSSLAAWLATGVAVIFYFLFKAFSEFSHRQWISFSFVALLITINTWFFFNSQQVRMDDPALAQRLEQNQISREMAEAELYGVGIGNFTLKMEEIPERPLKPWEFQPVHNVYFLILNENGVQGLLILILCIALLLNVYFKATDDYSLARSPSPIPFLVLLFVASFDHLLITSYLGPLMLALALSRTDVKV